MNDFQMYEEGRKEVIMLGNVCIAKMMGLHPIKGTMEGSGKEYYYYNNAEMQDFEGIPEYNHDWGDLMPVVEKINERDWVSIFGGECKIHSLIVDEFKTIKVIAEGESLREVVYEAVLKYAEWYAKNVKK